jgi:hypothetical protein
MEVFLEEFGSQIYDQIVAHVDRKERDIKVWIYNPIQLAPMT